MKRPRHRKGQGPLSRKNFRDFAAASDEWNKIAGHQIHLFHAKFNRLNRVRCFDFDPFLLIVLHEKSEEIQAVSLGSTRTYIAVDKPLNLCKGSLVIDLGIDRGNHRVSFNSIWSTQRVFLRA